MVPHFSHALCLVNSHLALTVQLFCHLLLGERFLIRICLSFVLLQHFVHTFAITPLTLYCNYLLIVCFLL